MLSCLSPSLDPDSCDKARRVKNQNVTRVIDGPRPDFGKKALPEQRFAIKRW